MGCASVYHEVLVGCLMIVMARATKMRTSPWVISYKDCCISYFHGNRFVYYDHPPPSAADLQCKLEEEQVKTQEHSGEVTRLKQKLLESG